MNLTATAHKWEHRWELALDGDIVTQVNTLDKAEQQLRDYLDTVDPVVDHRDWQITVEAALGDLSERV